MLVCLQSLNVCVCVHMGERRGEGTNKHLSYQYTTLFAGPWGAFLLSLPFCTQSHCFPYLSCDYLYCILTTPWDTAPWDRDIVL